jgi:hypothetical protein
MGESLMGHSVNCLAKEPTLMPIMNKYRRWPLIILIVGCALTIGIKVNATTAPGADDEARLLGQRVLGIKAALQDPAAPGSMHAVTVLGLDSRYYVLVRGWLGQQLEGDRSIAESSEGEVGHELKRRIEFIEQALRAIDLE